MPWIRSPWWDGIWILSSVPIGFMLLAASAWVAPRALTLGLMAILGTAHLISPMCLAWSRRDTRALALSRPVKFIGIPVVLLCLAAVAGFAATGMPSVTGLDFPGITTAQSMDYTNPLVILAATYVVWNAYHFGMQNFGVLTIYQIKSGARAAGQRHWDKIFCLVNIAVATAIPFVPHLPFHAYFLLPAQWGIAALALGGIIVMLLRERKIGFFVPRALFIVTTALGPFLALWWGYFNAKIHYGEWPWFPLWPSLWALAIITINHYLVSIGIAGHVFSRHQGWLFPMFVATVIVAGTAIFAAFFVDFRAMTLHITAIAVALRIGLGFVHFLYDRWLYKFSDPQVRATIGRDIFSLAPISCEPSVPSS
jgi:hypothetical protein